MVNICRSCAIETATDYDALLARQAKVQDMLDACNGWDLDSKLDLAMNSLRCPPADQKTDVLNRVMH